MPLADADLEPDRLPIRLGFVYHVPLVHVPGVGLFEREGATSRYLEAISRYVTAVTLLGPIQTASVAPEGWHRLRAENVYPYPLPYFDSPVSFLPRMPAIARALWQSRAAWDLLNLRVPTPASWLAFMVSRLAHKPAFLHVVGDLPAAMRNSTNRTLRQRLLNLYASLDQWANERMAGWCLTLVNGEHFLDQYRPHAPRLALTQNSTVRAEQIVPRADAPLLGRTVRLLAVNRVEPRKGVRYFPSILDALGQRGITACLTVVGPEVGQEGVEERRQTEAAAAGLGLSEQIAFAGSRSIDEVEQLYAEADIFVLASGPGEGVPRVLLEAMAAGLPVVASPAAGVPTVVHHEQTGLLAEPSDAEAFAAALERLVRDTPLRLRLRAGGQDLARRYTADAQAQQFVHQWLQEPAIGRLVAPRGHQPAATGQVVHSRSMPSFAEIRAGVPPVRGLWQLARTPAERRSVARYVARDLAAWMPFLGPGAGETALHVAGGVFHVGLRTGETYVLTELYGEAPYDRLEGYIPRPGWTVVDVGANVGVFAVRAAQRGARVLAYEPLPDCFRRLGKNLRANGVAERVQAFPYAVGDHATRARVLPGAFTTHSALAFMDNSSAESGDTTVPVRNLDDLLAEAGVDHADLLKLDVEGAECAVLRGASAVLDHTERVVLEYHSADNLAESLRLLDAHGLRPERNDSELADGSLGLLWAARPSAR